MLLVKKEWFVLGFRVTKLLLSDQATASSSRVTNPHRLGEILNLPSPEKLEKKSRNLFSLSLSFPNARSSLSVRPVRILSVNGNVNGEERPKKSNRPVALPTNSDERVNNSVVENVDLELEVWAFSELLANACPFRFFDCTQRSLAR